MFWIILFAALTQAYNLPDTALDPVGNWGPLTFYPDSAKDRLYKLPWDSGVVRYLNDGAFNRPTSHHKGYEFDFDMAIGTPVLAARAGYVYFLGAYGAGTDSLNNILQIVHTDWDTNGHHTTVDWYIHVQSNEITKLVTKPQWVEQGQLIAKSGRDGSYAHLHFEVQEMNHTGQGFKYDTIQNIESVPAPFVEETTAVDGIPWRFQNMRSRNKRFVPSAVETPGPSSKAAALYCTPNPFKTTLKIAVSGQRMAGSKISVAIYDIKGKMVYRLSATSYQLTAGITWNPTGLPAGVYLVKVKTDRAVYQARITKLK